MENASKALLIAAAVLIGILLINMWIFLSNNFKGVSEAYSDRFSTEEIQRYNAAILKNITTNESGENQITAQGIVTIVNLNKEKELGIEITLSNFGTEYGDTDDLYNKQSKFLKEKSFNSSNSEIKYYDVLNIEYTDGLISKIPIKE